MHISNNIKLKIDRHWFLLTMLFFVTWILFDPDLNYIHAEAVIALFLVYLIPIVNTLRNLSKPESRTVIGAFFFLLSITIYKIIGISSSGFDSFSQYYGWAILLIVGVINLKLFTERENRIQFYGLLCISMWYTLSLFLRSLTLSKDRGVRLVNASYSSMLMILTGFCVVWLLNDRRVIAKIIGLVGVFTTVYLNIVVLQRGTNFVLTIVMLIWLIFHNSEHGNASKRLIWFASIILLLMYLTGIYELVLTSLVERLDYRLAKRIREILVFLQTGDVAEARGFSGRTDLMVNSFRTWLQNIITIIFGVGDHRSTNSVIGNHSEMIDVFARFGLIGGINLWLLFLNHYKSLKRGMDTKICRQAGVVFAIYMLRNILGTTMTGPTSAVIIMLMSLVRINGLPSETI